MIFHAYKHVYWQLFLGSNSFIACLELFPIALNNVYIHVHLWNISKKDLLINRRAMRWFFNDKKKKKKGEKQWREMTSPQEKSCSSPDIKRGGVFIKLLDFF